jgi:excisionase family DNA binding protein
MKSRDTTTARPPRLIGAKPASREYGIKYGSLRDLAHRGELPVIRVGRAWYFDRVDVERWIERSKERAG